MNRICLLPDTRGQVQSKFRKRTCNPKFDESFVFQVNYDTYNNSIAATAGGQRMLTSGVNKAARCKAKAMTKDLRFKDKAKAKLFGLKTKDEALTSLVLTSDKADQAWQRANVSGYSIFPRE